MGIRAFTYEWRARRAGRRHVDNDLARSAREVVGPTGLMWSNGWDAMTNGSTAYLDSFDPHVPPSLFVAKNESDRRNHAVPLAERCIEDWSSDAPEPGPWDPSELET